MPRISQEVLKSVFFLYKSSKDAREGTNPSGSGFLVSFMSTEGGFHYALTNHHVAVTGGYSYIRLNKRDGGIDIIEFDPCEWCFNHVYGDLSAVMINLDHDIHDVTTISSKLFLTEHDVQHFSVGFGDDVFMIGLFIDDEREIHRQRNMPMARFGNISMMPSRHALFELQGQCRRSYFVLDLHSRSGFSGSPVFIFRVAWADLAQKPWEFINPSERHLFALLGVHCGQFREDWEIEMIKKHQDSEGVRPIDANAGTRIRGLSGMTLAAPAWDITALLSADKLKRERALAAVKRQESGVVLE